MVRKFAILVAAAAIAFPGSAIAAQAPAPADTGPSDAEIAHIAYTAGSIDIAAAKKALEISQNKAVRSFAEAMVRDHEAVNQKALALVKKLGVTPAPNGVSASLTSGADATLKRLSALKGDAFDRAYVANEVAFHDTVNGALRTTLIPSADNGELKALLQTGLTLFGEHQKHAEHVAAELGK